MTLAPAIHARPVRDSYLDLIKQFPLTHIADDGHLAEAQSVIDQLIAADLDEGQTDYLEALSDLVERYESDSLVFETASDADVLRELMDGNRFTQTQVAKGAKIAQSTISAVLRGDRRLTKDHVVRLAEFFHVSPSAFLS